ncbi:NUDIX hydrolase [Phytoactinopolyspora mesophila]|uniref:NUDIX domain-containing protein n=1 Tax=Phytoactinopolyspora mesophila TaxID=2650750 RepID=A0A7K3MBW5_9ACTN|nr:CoA pyrophosphatase [Phytoactinopolyspora mesophila]NDL60442.1 NUDIX domain-containing protein [Phytoactinopolyspora mesophila]
MSVPAWLRKITDAVADTPAEHLSVFTPPADGTARPASILMLFGESNGRPDVLLTQRASSLRSHAGQVSFPGGTIDPEDDGPVDAALREGAEETGLDPAGVDVLLVLPTLWIPVTNYAVAPVLAWWREPSPVGVVDASEVESVHRIPLDHLLDPANRLQVRHPSGITGPAFRVADLLVWGFTAGLLARLFDISGIDKPWDRTRVEELSGYAAGL